MQETTLVLLFFVLGYLIGKSGEREFKKLYEELKTKWDNRQTTKAESDLGITDDTVVASSDNVTLADGEEILSVNPTQP